MTLGVHSEAGKLRTVMVCRPGLAHRRLTPANREALLSIVERTITTLQNREPSATAAVATAKRPMGSKKKLRSRRLSRTG